MAASSRNWTKEVRGAKLTFPELKLNQLMALLSLSSLLTAGLAQEFIIPDPGLNAAIRETLSKPEGPLTVDDMLGLTNLQASYRAVASLEGLGAAHNLSTLYLDSDNL